MAQQHVICVDNNMQIAMGAWCRACGCAACGARCGPPGGSFCSDFLLCSVSLNIRLVSAAPCDNYALFCFFDIQIFIPTPHVAMSL